MKKVSELIREGCKLSAPTERGWHDMGPDGKLRTCALMAAAQAAGFIKDNGAGGVVGVSQGVSWDERAGAFTASIKAPDEWNYLAETAPCPFCGMVDQLIEVIPHLHDVHKQSREATAEWLEVIENKLQQAEGSGTKETPLVRPETSVDVSKAVVVQH